MKRVLTLLWLLAAGTVSAHSFGQNYILPVPIWMYLYGSAAALLASFVVVSYFINVRSIQRNYREFDLERIRLFQPKYRYWPIRILRTGSVFCLLLAIIAGFIGVNDPYRNINMTLFWVVFVLGFTYLTAVVGDLFATVNPWKVIVEWVEWFFPALFNSKVTFPAQLAYWPALILYTAFIWIELFGNGRPKSLSTLLLAYTLLNMCGCWMIGKQKWFEYCEFFSVFLRMIAKIAPIEYLPPRDSDAGQLRLRMPCAGLLKEPLQHTSLLVFILFMLSSTAFDGLKGTLPWVELFWTDLYQSVLIPLIGDTFYKTYPLLLEIYRGYQTAALLLSPFVYLGIYSFFIWLAKIITGSKIPLKQLILTFGLSLIPIAFVYHVTHYYTLLITQGMQIVRLASDPFGWGWNVFGTAKWAMTQIPDMGAVWHTQVFLIVLGHIVGVYLAHTEALKTFPEHRQAILSQLPIILLMVAFTAAGLWILALPASSGAPIG